MFCHSIIQLDHLIQFSFAEINRTCLPGFTYTILCQILVVHWRTKTQIKIAWW